jgi:hypothetical protein
LRRRLASGGYVLLETYGVAKGELEREAAMRVFEAGEVYARDDYVYWGFTGASLSRLADHAGFGRVEIMATPVIDGHPRIVGTLRADK